jgi:hypothetical protein
MKKILTIVLVVFSLFSFGQGGIDELRIKTNELILNSQTGGTGITPIGVNSSGLVIEDTTQVSKSDSTVIFVTPHQIEGLVKSTNVFTQNNSILKSKTSDSTIIESISPSFVHTSTGVGIGTLTPEATLDVIGEIAKDHDTLMLNFTKKGLLGVTGTILKGKGINSEPEFSNTLDGVLKYASTQTYTSDLDLITKGDLDAASAGIIVKTPVDVATTGENLDLSGTETIDGYSATAGKRVLVHTQTDAKQNGVYIVASGSWSRATDFDTWSELYRSYVTVLYGDSLSGSSYVASIDDDGVIGDSLITFSLFVSPSNIVGGDALEKTGNTLDVKTDNSTIEISSDALRVKDSGITDAKISTGISAAKIADGSVSNTEIQYISTVTSNVQTQLDAKADTATTYTRTQIDAMVSGVDMDMKADTATTYTRTQIDAK